MPAAPSGILTLAIGSLGIIPGLAVPLGKGSGSSPPKRLMVDRPPGGAWTRVEFLFHDKSVLSFVLIADLSDSVTECRPRSKKIGGNDFTNLKALAGLMKPLREIPDEDSIIRAWRRMLYGVQPICANGQHKTTGKTCTRMGEPRRWRRGRCRRDQLLRR